MIRFLSFLLGKPYESCKSCEVLKQQLEFERSEKRLLIDTLVNIVKPTVVEAPPVEINQVAQTSGLWARRRAAMEAKDREEARILAERKHVAMPDNILNIPRDQNKTATMHTNVDINVEQLERELGVEEGA